MAKGFGQSGWNLVKAASAVQNLDGIWSLPFPYFKFGYSDDVAWGVSAQLLQEARHIYLQSVFRTRLSDTLPYLCTHFRIACSFLPELQQTAATLIDTPSGRGS